MEIRQLKFESKLSIVRFKSPNNYDDNITKAPSVPILFDSNILITAEPINSVFGTIELKKTDLEFKNLNSFKFIQLKSDTNFYLRLNKSLVLTTKIFNYFNHEQKLNIEVANSTLKLFSEDMFEILPNSKNINVSYFLCDFDANLNINWEELYA